MLTDLRIRNFKRFESVDLELGSPVVFAGPNNSGKTSAIQALGLWRHGLRAWHQQYGHRQAPKRLRGIRLGRRELVSIPVTATNALWHQLHLRDVIRHDKPVRTTNVRIEITVKGFHAKSQWECGLEFDYANEDWMYCRPLRVTEGRSPERMPIPEEAYGVRIASFPPMSGLAIAESRLDQGAIDVLIGEGRTSEVLRNLCLRVLRADSGKRWKSLASAMQELFGCELEEPDYVRSRGEIRMAYHEAGTRFDISSGGRGMHQALVLLAYMYAHPGAVILLDEPDAHLEIPRQRQTYALLTEVASELGSQIIAASHSEVLLNEAAGRDMVVAFVGKPHRIDRTSSGSPFRKALREIGFEHYVQAEQTGWVLYLEGSADLAILRAMARRLGHKGAILALEKPFVQYVGNQPAAVEKHFFGIREALPSLRGVALFDRLARALPDQGPVRWLQWNQREIENYLCTHGTLLAFARGTAKRDSPGLLFTEAEVGRRISAMEASIQKVSDALRSLGKESPWGGESKVSDDFLTPVFRNYFRRLGLPNLMARKTSYELAEYVPIDEIPNEMHEKLDAIASVAEGSAS